MQNVCVERCDPFRFWGDIVVNTKMCSFFIAVRGGSEYTPMYAPPEWQTFNGKKCDWFCSSSSSQPERDYYEGRLMQAGDVFCFGATMVATWTGNHALECGCWCSLCRLLLFLLQSMMDWLLYAVGLQRCCRAPGKTQLKMCLIRAGVSVRTKAENVVLFIWRNS